MFIVTNWNESKGKIWQKNKWRNWTFWLEQKMSNLATENALFRQRFPDFSVAALFKSLILIKKVRNHFRMKSTVWFVVEFGQKWSICTWRGFRRIFSETFRPVRNWESSDDKERKSLSLFYEWFLNDDLNDFDEIDESQPCLSP